MGIKIVQLKKLSIDDGEAVYAMLQTLPAGRKRLCERRGGQKLRSLSNGCWAKTILRTVSGLRTGW